MTLLGWGYLRKGAVGRTKRTSMPRRRLALVTNRPFQSNTNDFYDIFWTISCTPKETKDLFNPQISSRTTYLLQMLDCFKFVRCERQQSDVSRAMSAKRSWSENLQGYLWTARPCSQMSPVALGVKCHLVDTWTLTLCIWFWGVCKDAWRTRQ